MVLQVGQIVEKKYRPQWCIEECLKALQQGC